ncbi:Ig-like domain-containing protein [Luteimicrobium xylanilyticum]|uniref:Ig-like domain-containing protein n=1 Tax=Luteimicrobium xylanilyticum TaxID=1133546 RepID=UPI0011D1D75A|nr:Ig-like domain-containing protein [Luteimicrobium xylanilyticum]
MIATPKGQKRTVQDSDVRSLVSDVSGYWSGQTNGRASFTVKTIKYVTATATCSSSSSADNTSVVTKLWTQGSKAVTSNKQDWWGGGSPKTGPAAREHLVVLYPFAAGDPHGLTTCNGMLGLGTTPTKASVGNSGLTFALFGASDAAADHANASQFYESRQSLAHELGHNFGLQHASMWWCLKGASDGAFSSLSCLMASYLDPYDVMGGGNGDKGIPALSGPQKIRLGLLSTAQRRTVTDTTALTLQPVPASEKGAPAGLQAAQVKDPSTGEVYTVEYRPSLPGVTFPATDLGSPFGTYDMGGSGDYTVDDGVRVMRLATSQGETSWGNWSKNEQAIVPIGPASNRTSYLPDGKTFTTRSGKVSIRVAAQGATASVSFVVHRKARLSVARTATTQRYAQTAVRVTARTATTNGVRPTGTVTFKDGSRTLKTVRTSSAGVAAYTLPKTLSVKTHSVTATFSPDAATKARYVEAIAVGTKVKVTKASAAASVRLAHTKIKKGSKPKVTVKVAVKGITKPTGTIKVYENGHKVKTVKLTSSRKGKITVTLPKTKKRGTVKIVAKYSGTSKIAAKTTKTVKLKVR